MTEASHPREALAQSPAEIFPLLPAMGRVMLSTRFNGAIHERMGDVGSVTIEDGKARLTGEFHDSVIDLSVVTRVIADRSGKMRDKVLPKLECQDASGETVFSLIGLEGLEPFDDALAALGAGTALEPVTREAPAGGAAPELPADDLGAATFAAILANGQPVAIDFSRPGLFQHWAGALPEPKPSMGFVNIMQGDFHLHLKAGAVSGWGRREADGDVLLLAQDADGQEIGLVLRGPAPAFVGVPAMRDGADRG
jgi:putative heme degradation protein